MSGKAGQHVILSPLNGQLRGGQFNGHVTEVVSLMEGEWSCYRGGQFNGEGRMVVTIEGEWSC